MKAPAARRALPTPRRTKERRSQQRFPRAPVPAPLPIHFYCKARWARASLETAPADSGRAVWCRAIPVEKVDKVRAEDAVALEAEGPAVDKVARAASVDQAGAAGCLAEHPAGAGAAECLAGAED